MPYTYRYPHPALTADSVVVGFDGAQLHLLLIRRGAEPCKGQWAFPGGFMNIDETAEQCALRELYEETGLRLQPAQLRQVGAFSAVHRDPRERIVTVAFYLLMPLCDVQGGDDAADARWWPIDALPPLAFDHGDILRQAVARIRQDLLTDAAVL